MLAMILLLLDSEVKQGPRTAAWVAIGPANGVVAPNPIAKMNQAAFPGKREVSRNRSDINLASLVPEHTALDLHTFDSPAGDFLELAPQEAVAKVESQKFP